MFKSILKTLCLTNGIVIFKILLTIKYALTTNVYILNPYKNSCKKNQYKNYVQNLIANIYQLCYFFQRTFPFLLHRECSRREDKRTDNNIYFSIFLC